MNQDIEIEDLLEDLVTFRRDIHANPELAYKEVKTAEKVADSLREIGLDVTTGVGKTGVVGSLKVGNSSRSIGLRADMDALPIVEETGLPYASCHHGVFHGCGHDGHTTMLLGAAQHLARTRNFDGTVHFIFQPAEEGEAGAKAMIDDGLFERFPCDRVYAFHNWPDLPAGTISTRCGPIMAAADKFSIQVKGKGGHAAVPHQTPDAILAASELVSQLNTIVSRRISPTSTAVLSVTQISGGNSHNVLPSSVSLTGTVRTFDPHVQDLIEAAVRQVITGVSVATGTQISIDYQRYYPATINASVAAEHALMVAKRVGNAVEAPEAAFTSEDFAFMLQACEGAYVWLGQGTSGEHIPLHHPGYDFNDGIIATGVKLHVALVEDFLPSNSG
ncbi:MAG: peptidase M20 [Alteromonadaceae bacterium]|uniref:M20 aminoacylase family protein n=1 Tax=Paraglaciecola chathamensis TaxID=368405 RepID=UPI000C6C32C0|nr:M20 aminoacylase family protein [Paraglaciecola agarilytica]MBN26408.1 peptidase M20 [Alteromonadaceae bacterium]|tara:strand:+ start:62012 stop:63178 length:1167 start_codon:yes stop_codon:yes gene_type:complete